MEHESQFVFDLASKVFFSFDKSLMMELLNFFGRFTTIEIWDCRTAQVDFKPFKFHLVVTFSLSLHLEITLTVPLSVFSSITLTGSAYM